ncbi:MAG: transporter, partial [Proteobacteria bacterium]|nr:transporter [Pseudomonadota bacterium]
MIRVRAHCLACGYAHQIFLETQRRHSCLGPRRGVKRRICTHVFRLFHPVHTESLQLAAAAPILPETPFRFIAHFVWRFRVWFILMALLEAGQAASSILIPYAIGRTIDVVTKGGGLGSADLGAEMQLPLWLFVAFGVGEVLFSRASGACLVLVGPRLRKTVSGELFAYLQHHSQRYFSDHFAGALAHRITETATSLNHTVWTILFDFWPVSIVFGVSVALLYRAHPQLGYFVAAWAAVFVAASYWLAVRCRPYAQNYAATRSEVNGKVVDSVSNLASIRLFARLEHEREYLDGYLDKEMRTARRTFWYMERVRWFQFTAALVLKLGTVWYALQLWRAGAIGVADFAMSTSLALLIISDARNLSRRFLEFFEYVGNVANGVEVIVQPHEMVDTPASRPVRIARGRIDFHRVSFGYGAEKRVFDGLDVSIAPGQKVGLVGFSGSGKSTFVSLILRMYDPQQGAILIDGTDIRAMTQDSLHAQISLIPQDPSLFHRTLRDNIRYGRLDADDEEVTMAAQQAHAHDFIAGLKDGYDALVGERGVKLSGGQRQRIAIARVILKDSPILILDEATSSLDSVTEKSIQDSLDRFMSGKTVIVVAHRLSTIAHLDRILVFDAGRIVEDGTHAELLARGG